jgi:adenylate kinase
VVDAFQLPHVSTGDIMRQAVRDGSKLGQRVAEFLHSGQLVPDLLVVDLVTERLSQKDCEAGCLLDGFPRTRPQAEALDRYLEQTGRSLTAVLRVVVPAEELRRRMLARAEHEGRTDDTPQTIAARLQVYTNETAPLVDYYRQRGILHDLDGSGTPDEVFARIRVVLEGLGRGPEEVG